MRLISDTTLDNIAKPFKYISGILIFLYVMIYIGIISYEPSYVRALTIGFNTFTCLFLIYKFNPLRKNQQLTETDSNLIFFAALFIIMSTSITEFALSFFNSLKNVFKDDISSIQ